MKKNFSTVVEVKTKLAIEMFCSVKIGRYSRVVLVESGGVPEHTIQSRIGYVPNVLPVKPY